jgi:cytoskeletal protein RodZ
MNGAHPDDDRADELTKRYRAASAADPARPGHAVRDSILAYARTVAADRATHGMARAPRRRPAASDFGWRISAAASVIVAGLATLLAWHSHAPTRVAEREPNSLSPQVAAHDPTTQLDRPADTAPAPNAVTTRSRQRADARAEAPPRAYDKDPGTEGGSVASSLQAPARLGAGAQFAPSAAAAPPGVQAPRSQALDAAASARAGVASNAPLVMAAESGNLEFVDQLLHSGVGTEQTDAHGRTALLVATLHGDMTMARRLLAAGARVDAVDAAGDTPLAVARRQGPPELAQLLERASHP